MDMIVTVACLDSQAKSSAATVGGLLAFMVEMFVRKRNYLGEGRNTISKYLGAGRLMRHLPLDRGIAQLYLLQLP
jgi:hypothetical protein